MKARTFAKTLIWILVLIILFSVIYSISGRGNNDPNTALNVDESYSGKTVFYTPASRFSVILDQDKYPIETFHILCNPGPTVGRVSSEGEIAPPLYEIRFEAVIPGVCELEIGDFKVEIVVVPEDL